MELNELMLDVFKLESKLFRKTDSYRFIEQKCSKKCLTSGERKLLHSEIHDSFERLIKTIKEACPSLTDEDVTFCCLEKSCLDSLIIGHCMGDVNKQPVNQRKYRIKKKMKEAGCDYLFDVIFSCHS